MPPSPAYRPETIHAALGPTFFDPVQAARFPTHILRHRDQRAAARVGLDTLTDAEWTDHFGRFAPLPGSFDTPLALRYHGHQFRAYNPDLGDGRGFLFAQLRDAQDHRLLDLGTKGSGTTPWSRSGDGRLTLKGGVRELLATTYLEAAGVDTSRTFSLIETGEALHRGDEPSPTRAAVLVRLSHSHIRIGTFQRLAFHDDTAAIARLIEHVIAHTLPDARHDDPAGQAIAFLDTVAARVARTGARWMAAGFVHGVLNTDNINVTGESFDYGPWRFLPTCDPAFTAAYFDHGGLYAYGRQPEALLWNLTRLAECLLPLADQPALEEVLHRFAPTLHAEYAAALLARLGLAPRSPAEDAALARTLSAFLVGAQCPYEQAIFDLRAGLADPDRLARSPSAAFYAVDAFGPVRDALLPYAPRAATLPEHPYFAAAVPCTLLVEEVEALWAPIAAADDWAPLHAKLGDIEYMRRAYGT